MFFSSISSVVISSVFRPWEPFFLSFLKESIEVSFSRRIHGRSGIFYNHGFGIRSENRNDPFRTNPRFFFFEVEMELISSNFVEMQLFSLIKFGLRRLLRKSTKYY